MVPYLGSLWIRVVFHFIVHSAMLTSCKYVLSCKARIHVFHHGLIFSNFLSLALSDFWCMFASGHSLSSIFHVIYLFSLSCIFFTFQYFTPKLFCFFCIRLLNCLCVISTYLLVEFSFITLESPFFVCIAWPYVSIVWVSLLSPTSFDLFILIVLSDLPAVVFLKSFHISLGSCAFYLP